MSIFNPINSDDDYRKALQAMPREEFQTLHQNQWIPPDIMAFPNIADIKTTVAGNPKDIRAPRSYWFDYFLSFDANPNIREVNGGVAVGCWVNRQGNTSKTTLVFDEIPLWLNRLT